MPPKKQVEEKKAPVLGRIGTNLKVQFLNFRNILFTFKLMYQFLIL